jgi:hypothetical protein
MKARFRFNPEQAKVTGMPLIGSGHPILLFPCGSGRGLALPGGKAGFRVEWDPRTGAHINAWAGKAKSVHFKFSGNAKSVQSLLRILYCR